MSKMANAPQEQVDETNDKIDKSIAEIRAGDEYSMGNQLKGFFVFLAVFAVFGLLEALILKKKDPESN